MWSGVWRGREYSSFDELGAALSCYVVAATLGHQPDAPLLLWRAATPENRDSWMWDLSVPGGNDADRPSHHTIVL